MIKANFNAYDTYITDSLYQWDLNRVLSVSGLNLAVAPEIHFSNADMDRAIVRQATLENFVVKCKIPNSLLQTPLKINAHIGIYEGETFKVIEKVEIPVIARKRPADYQIEDADEEIYSFKRLENMIEQIDEKWSAFTLATVDEAVNEWLTEHPEATTTVQDGALTEAKFSEELKVHTIKDYVTPEMFGAKGDGVTDDTDAISSALNVGKTVLLSGKYLCKDITLPRNCKIILLGRINLQGTITVKYPNCTIDGSGTIYCTSENAFILYGANENGYQCNNFDCKGITLLGSDTNTCFLITNINGGNVYFINIDTHISGFNYGILSQSKNEVGWFTGLTVKGIIESCPVAIALLWGGDGSMIYSQIQPKVNAPNSINDALITIGNNTKFAGMIWDENTANNITVLHSMGNRNIISTPVKQTKMVINYPNTTDICDYNVSLKLPTKNYQSSLPFSYNKTGFLQTNNMLYGKGLHTVTVTPNSAKDKVINLIHGDINNLRLSEDITIEFDFNEYLPLREMYFIGDDMPDKIKMYYKDNTNTYHLLKSFEKGKDYNTINGGNAIAFWGFTYDVIPGFGYEEYARGVKFEVESTSDYNILGLYAMVSRPNYLSRYGDDIIANSFKLKGNDGKIYTVSVNNGQLVLS